MTLLDLISEYVRENAIQCEGASDRQRTVTKVWFQGKREPRFFLIQTPTRDAVLTAFEVHEIDVKQWPPARNKGGEMMLSL